MSQNNQTVKNIGSFKHGESKTRLYIAWINMKQRCNNPHAKNYKHWGGKGISVCSDWLDFIPFRDWALANGYKDHLTIDRKNNNGNYNPKNCRWVTAKTQSRNTKKIRSNNTSGYRGVFFKKKHKIWHVVICVNYKRIHLGYFKCRRAAAYAYDSFIESNNLEHTKNF